MYSKTSSPFYVRDDNTGAVLNTNDAEYHSILLHRKHRKEIDNYKTQVDDLQKQFQELRSFLLKEKE